MYAVFCMLPAKWAPGELDHTVQLFDAEDEAVAWCVEVLVCGGQIVRDADGWYSMPDGDFRVRDQKEALYGWQELSEPFEFLHVYTVVDRRRAVSHSQ